MNTLHVKIHPGNVWNVSKWRKYSSLHHKASCRPCSYSSYLCQDASTGHWQHLDIQTCRQSGAVFQTPEAGKQAINNVIAVSWIHLVRIKSDWCRKRTDSFIWSVEVKIYNVADSFLQHDFLVVWVHETHELGVFQSVQQQLGNPRLVLLCCHMHDIVAAALLHRHNKGTCIWIRK